MSNQDWNLPEASRSDVNELIDILTGSIRDNKIRLEELKCVRMQFPGALTAEYVYEKWLHNEKHRTASIPSYIDWWDIWSGPFRRANLYCLAGYQGTGKTTFAVNLTWRMALKGFKVWNVCLELTAEEMFEVVAGHIFGKSALAKEDLATAYATIQPTGYRFYEPERDMSWEQTLQRVTDTVRKEKIDFVVIDNFSYLTSVARNSYDTERVVAKALKGLAQELEIPILVIAHLRKPDRDDIEPNPTAHSVLGSGAITQVASDTFILHLPLKGDEDSLRHPIGYVLSGKPRWGAGGRRYVYYAGDKRKFYEATAERFREQFSKENVPRRLKHAY